MFDTIYSFQRTRDRAMTEDIPMKKCTGPCGQEYPATSEYFNSDKNGKYKLKARCRECLSTYSKERNKRPEIKLRAQEREKIRTRQYKSNLERRSKQAARKKERYHNDTEYRTRKLAIDKAYHNRPEVKERKHAYNQEYGKEYRKRPEAREKRRTRDNARNHRPDIRAKRLIKFQEYRNRPEIQERRRAYKKYYNKRPEVQLMSRTYNHTKRALNRSVKGTHTHEQIQEKLKKQKHKCYYCKARLRKIKGRYIYHIEHTFPLSRVVWTDIPANSIDYLVLSCPTCNLSKGDKFPWEWAEGGRLL